jgi:nucleotide-binding universal stress UspA family protein
MEQIKSIVVPVDFYENTDKLVDYAAYIAGALSAQLNFIHVVNLISGHMIVVEPLSVEFLTRYEKDMQQRMEKLVESIQDRCPGSTGSVVSGEAVRDIVEYARTNDADLIIISTHGTKGLESILLGSVARRVVKHAPCPVLVMNPFKGSPRED